MNRRIRLAVMAPLAVSALTFGSVSLLAGSAQAAAPSLSCSVKQSATAGKYDVTLTGGQPGVEVTFTGGTSNHRFISSTQANDSGVASTGGFIPVGAVTAEQGGKKITCGTVKEAEQQDARAQYSAGFKKGFDETKANCKAAAPPQGFNQLDPNFEKGFNAGAKAALESKFCAG
ncbi:hypothetical protein ABZ934_19760 [Streptomyces sp. NPDC046557]|uniref:hypothetical protein n=1 Tax=Streptomyces sp. NPDC046557 TaxID=3155372 RepID=UPI003400DB7A